MKTILVTGGAGFIGSHISDRLLRDNYHVVILDSLKTGIRSYIHPSATFIKGDVRSRQTVDAVVKKYRPNAVFHIAGQASTITSFTDPMYDVEVNFHGTINVVTACIAHRVPRLLYASSMTVYGHPKHLPISEEVTCQPVSYYGISKFAAERFVHATANRTDLKTPLSVTSFRMFNVYGPRQSLTNPYQGVMAIFIGQVLRGESVTVFGDGKQARDFVYIDDVISAWMKALNSKRGSNQIFNLGFGTKISINELLTSIITACGNNPSTYPIRYDKERPGDQRFMQANIEKLTRLLRYTPNTTLTQGLSKTIAWAKTA